MTMGVWLKYMKSKQVCVVYFHGSGARVIKQLVTHVRNAPVSVSVCVG